MQEIQIPEKVMLSASEVAALLGVKTCMAYKVIKQCNEELAKMGKLTNRGKVNKKYLLKKLEV